MKKRRQKGQVMLLTVMLLSGAILGATSLASLMILFQLRQTADIKSSMQAIYAADAGIECVWQSWSSNGDPALCTGTLDNGAEYRVVETAEGVFKSVGRSGRSARALELTVK
jgi:hypothetical protein